MSADDYWDAVHEELAQHGYVHIPALRARFADLGAGALDKLEADLQVYLAMFGAIDGRPEMVVLSSFTGYEFDPDPARQVIGRGGMNSIHRATATGSGFNRPLAIKVPLSRLVNDRAVCDYLRREARITARLQHPAVVPVYEAGEYRNLFPFFSMKVVEGQTLRARLEARAAPADDLPALLGVFVKVCEALAFAHSQGVIHRDLKPDNVMLGRYGEVQVMDWGLARDLSQPGDDVPGRLRALLRFSARFGASDPVGCEPYMSPEQATDDSASHTQKTDSFGLGGILCHILTGHPVYTGRPEHELRAMARAGDIAVVRERLTAAQVQPELAALTVQCLSFNPTDRPTADQVAVRVLEFQASAEKRARDAELSRARAEEQTVAARNELVLNRRRKRWQLTALTVTLVLASAVSSGALWYRADRKEQEYAAEKREREAENRRQIELVKFNERASFVRSGLDEVIGHQTRDQLTDARRGLAGIDGRAAEGVPAELLTTVAEARRNQAMAERLDRIHQQLYAVTPGSELAFVGVNSAYAAAFAEFNLDLRDPPRAAARIRASPIRNQLIAGLSMWSNFVQDAEKVLVLEVVSAASETDWERKFHDPKLRTSLLRMLPLLANVPVEHLSAAQIEGLAAAMIYSDQIMSGAFGNADAVFRDTEALLRRGVQRHRSDFGLNLMLGMHLLSRARLQSGDVKMLMQEEGLGYFRAAVAARPDSAVGHNALALGLLEAGRPAEAESAARGALQLIPRWGPASLMLGAALEMQNKPQDAEAVLRAASDEGLESFQRSAMLGMALLHQKKLVEAQQVLKQAVELAGRPGGGADAPTPSRTSVLTNIHLGLAKIQLAQGDLAGLRNGLRECTRHYPKAGEAWARLALTLVHFGDLDEAGAAAREAIRQPSRLAHEAVTMVALHRGDIAAAARARQTAMTYPDENGKPASAVDKFRAALTMTTLLNLQRDTLPSYRKGTARPFLNSDRLLAAELSLCLGQPAAALRYYDEGLRVEAGKATTPSSMFSPLSYRSAAARAAAQASAGRGDADKLDAEERAAARQQALRWLQAELDVFHKASSAPQRAAARSAVQIWQAHPDFIPLRDEPPLRALPNEEQGEWQKFWTDASEMLAALDRD